MTAATEPAASEPAAASPVVRDATPADLVAILAIYNDAVANTTAIWNEVLSDLDGRRAWFEERTGRGFPVLVAVVDGAVAGYATYGPFRPHDGYRHTVEHSIYVDAAVRGRGIGRAMLAALLDRARAAGLHVMVGGVEAGNSASIALHERLGFEKAALLRQVGRKFDRWLDLQFMQKTLG